MTAIGISTDEQKRRLLGFHALWHYANWTCPYFEKSAKFYEEVVGLLRVPKLPPDEVYFSQRLLLLP